SDGPGHPRFRSAAPQFSPDFGLHVTSPGGIASDRWLRQWTVAGGRELGPEGDPLTTLSMPSARVTMAGEWATRRLRADAQGAAPRVQAHQAKVMSNYINI